VGELILFLFAVVVCFFLTLVAYTLLEYLAGWLRER